METMRLLHRIYDSAVVLHDASGAYHDVDGASVLP